MLDLDNHYYIKRIAIDLSKAFSRSRVSINLGNVSSGEGSGKLVRWWRKLFSRDFIAFWSNVGRGVCLKRF